MKHNFTTFGPLMKRMLALSDGDRAGLKNALIAGLDEFNQSGDETMVLPFDYLEVVATVRGEA